MTFDRCKAVKLFNLFITYLLCKIRLYWFQLISFFMLLLALLYSEVMVLLIMGSYSTFVNRERIVVLSVNMIVFSEDLIKLITFCNFFWKWFLAFFNLMFRASTCFGVFEDLSPYHSVFNPFLFVLSLQNAFYLSLFWPSSSFLLS